MHSQNSLWIWKKIEKNYDKVQDKKVQSLIDIRLLQRSLDTFSEYWAHYQLSLNINKCFHTSAFSRKIGQIFWLSFSLNRLPNRPKSLLSKKFDVLSLNEHYGPLSKSPKFKHQFLTKSVNLLDKLGSN